MGLWRCHVWLLRRRWTGSKGAIYHRSQTLAEGGIHEILGQTADVARNGFSQKKLLLDGILDKRDT